jgi:DNA-binding transcriptional MerR regulator/effector-binding domain-containing protein
VGSSQDLLPIGQFAEASRLSLKALRIYDRLGLLRPVRVDEQTGYRYYHEDQLRAARLISLLRRLEMPLALIKDVLEADAAAAVSLIAEFWSDTERRISEGRNVIEYIHQLIRGGAPMGYDVKTRQVEGAQALSVTQEVFVKDLSGFIHTAATALYRHVAASGGRAEGHLTVIYHGEVGEDSNGPVEVCLPVRQGSVSPGETVRLVELGAGTQAYTTITHAQLRFPEILKAYDAVYGWMKQNGRRPAGPPREIYFADLERARPNDPVCDVAWPVLSEPGV